MRPGQVLSLQYHHRRSEHWTVVHGTPKVRVGEEEFLLERNQSTYIPVGTRHRIENPGTVPLHLIEVQSGSYLGEDDIREKDGISTLLKDGDELSIIPAIAGGKR